MKLTQFRFLGGEGPVEFAIVRVYRSGGDIDETGITTMKNANAANVSGCIV